MPVAVKRLVVIGNGATAVDRAGISYVNRHTAAFLGDLACLGHQISFIQPLEAWGENTSLYDSPLSTDLVCSRPLSTRNFLGLIDTMRTLLWALAWADFVYLFYPGKLPRVIARICGRIGKPYGLYLRGEAFSIEGVDAPVFRKARCIVAVSRSLLSSIRPINSNIIPIRPMFDYTVADVKRRHFAASFDRPVRLLFVGRLEQAKGIPELLEATKLLRSRGVLVELVLVGGGAMYESLSASHGNRLGEAVRVVGVITGKSELMDAYETADIFVLPSHHEGFPRVLFEAMIKSAVIVTTMVGGIPGLMKDGENCIGIPVGNPPAIADAVQRLSQDSELMEKLSTHGLETVITVLSTYPSHAEVVAGQFNV